MLKKIVLVALFVAASATGTVFARPAMKAPVPEAPRGFCPLGNHC
jgi:hypothetical protein